MKSSYGSLLRYTLFGESHSAAIGITIEGIQAGITFDFDDVNQQLTLRSGNSTFNTPRKEKIEYDIVSGYFNDKTTGTPMTVLFYNQNTRSKDYSNLVKHPRPGHADYVATMKYQTAQDYRGGGHFSGRLTTPLVFLGALTTQLIQKQYPDFAITSHIASFAGIRDASYYDLRRAIAKSLSNEIPEKIDAAFLFENLESDFLIQKLQKELQAVHEMLLAAEPTFPLISKDLEESMLAKAIEARKAHDSLGGQIESVVINPPLSLGEPFFHSVESVISSLLFSIGTVKGVEFGLGSDFINAFGSHVKDEIIHVENGKALTLLNYNGGINGGITNGEDIVINIALKPIASIMQEQYSYNFEADSIQPLKINGRHDATIINRVVPVINAVISIAIYDLLLQQRMNGAD